MIFSGRPAKVLLIDTNVYFSKRLSDALKREGFEVSCSTQPAFALTTLEYDTPTAIVCSTNMREMGALEIARLVRADSRNSALPIIALGDGSQRALMEAFQAGCDDYVDRSRPPGVLAAHIRNIIISKAEGFQPTQMLSQSDTSLSGSLTHHDLPGVMQMLGHAHQTGALHINSGDTDALLFFDAGAITHAECASLFGDEAVIHILKSCMRNNSGVYKFVYGSASPQSTVLRSTTDLMLDAMRELDESAHAADPPGASEWPSLEGFSELAPQKAGARPADAALSQCGDAANTASEASSGCAPGETGAPGHCAAGAAGPGSEARANQPEQLAEPAPDELREERVAPLDGGPSPEAPPLQESAAGSPELPPEEPAEPSDSLGHAEAEPFANYSIVPTFENEDIS
jgi:CheY-like chemotaxis protein